MEKEWASNGGLIFFGEMNKLDESLNFRLIVIFSASTVI